MTDWLSVMERGLKAVRFGIFQASDNLAMLLDGFCRAPEYVPHGIGIDGTCAECDFPDSAVASPAAAVVAPSPKQGSDSPPRDSAIPPAPSGGTPTFGQDSGNDVGDGTELSSGATSRSPSRDQFTQRRIDKFAERILAAGITSAQMTVVLGVLAEAGVLIVDNFDPPSK